MHVTNLLVRVDTVINLQNIVPFMDNAGCHPEDIKDNFSKIKIIILPASTTSVLQPLDLGIIKNFMVHYRTRLLWFIISKTETFTKASEVTMSINIIQLNYNFIFHTWPHVTHKYLHVKFKNFPWKSWFTQGIKNHKTWNATRHVMYMARVMGIVILCRGFVRYFYNYAFATITYHHYWLQSNALKLYMRLDLRLPVFHAHNNKLYFLPLHDSCTH